MIGYYENEEATKKQSPTVGSIPEISVISMRMALCI